MTSKKKRLKTGGRRARGKVAQIGNLRKQTSWQLVLHGKKNLRMTSKKKRVKPKVAKQGTSYQLVLRERKSKRKVKKTAGIYLPGERG